VLLPPTSPLVTAIDRFIGFQLCLPSHPPPFRFRGYMANFFFLTTFLSPSGPEHGIGYHRSEPFVIRAHGTPPFIVFLLSWRPRPRPVLSSAAISACFPPLGFFFILSEIDLLSRPILFPFFSPFLPLLNLFNSLVHRGLFSTKEQNFFRGLRSFPTVSVIFFRTLFFSLRRHLFFFSWVTPPPPPHLRRVDKLPLVYSRPFPEAILLCRALPVDRLLS